LPDNKCQPVATASGCGSGPSTHHRRRSDPAEYGVNIANFPDVDVRAFMSVPYADGVDHPADRL